jgi:hypothetical protein
MSVAANTVDSIRFLNISDSFLIPTKNRFQCRPHRFFSARAASGRAFSAFYDTGKRRRTLMQKIHFCYAVFLLDALRAGHIFRSAKNMASFREIK